MGIAKRNKPIKIGYHLSKENLEELENIMNELTEGNREKEITYSVYFKDGKRVSDLTLKELLERPNVGKTEITDIFVSTIFFHKNSLRVGFSNNPYQPVHYELSVEDEKQLEYFEGKIDTYIAGLKTMYSALSVSQFWMSFFVFLIFFAILIPGLIKLERSFIDIPNFTYIFIILGGISGGLIALGTGRIQKKYFPVGEFLIGNGIKRAEHNKFVRIGVILSLILSLIATYFSKFI